MGKKTTTYKSVVSVNCHPPDGQKSNPSTARDLGAKNVHGYLQVLSATLRDSTSSVLRLYGDPLITF